MKLVKKYLLVEVKDDTWKILGKRPFNSDDQAWEWADRHYKKDEDRLRLYLFPIDVPAT